MRKHVADEVFERLAKLIVSGALEPDSTLPPERDLAQRFDVSRLIVRQAVHRLAELGLVRVRQGGATTIVDAADCDHPLVSVLALRYSPWREQVLASLRERQMVGSVSMLLLAARRVQPEDIAQLRALLDSFEDEPEQFEQLNEAFWTRIALITGNPFCRRDTRFWFRVAREAPDLAERAMIPSVQRVEAYREIIDRLEAGDGAAERFLRVANSVLELIDQRNEAG